MSVQEPTIFVVDDDASVRRSIERLLAAHEFEVRSYPTAEAFLADPDTNRHGCLVLDVRLPQKSGLDLQTMLAGWNWSLPIVFITGHGEVETGVRAMRNGAITMLQKPFKQEALLAAVAEALERDRSHWARRTRFLELSRRFATLTDREHQVLKKVLEGQLNKQIAYELGIVEKTVKVHRARAMAKIGATSIIEAVRLATEYDNLTKTAVRGTEDATSTHWT